MAVIATCSIDGFREATTITEWDGRTVPACSRCLAPVPTPTTMLDIEALPSIAARAIAVALAWEGLRSSEIGDRLGLDRNDATRNAVASGLSQAVRSGYLRREGTCSGGWARYYAGAKRWLPENARAYRSGRNWRAA